MSMSELSPEEIEALRALARAEGKSVEEMARELLRERVGRALTRRSGGGIYDQDITPVTPPTERDRRETPDQARERWLEEEQRDPTGVLGLGGMTSGGIFGDGAVVLDGYDPVAMARAETRALQMMQARSARLVAQLEERAAALGLLDAPRQQVRQLGRRR
jgi:hypothetical protein